MVTIKLTDVIPQSSMKKIEGSQIRRDRKITQKVVKCRRRSRRTVRHNKETEKARRKTRHRRNHTHQREGTAQTRSDVRKNRHRMH